MGGRWEIGGSGKPQGEAESRSCGAFWISSQGEDFLEFVQRAVKGFWARKGQNLIGV